MQRPMTYPEAYEWMTRAYNGIGYTPLAWGAIRDVWAAVREIPPQIQEKQ